MFGLFKKKSVNTLEAVTQPKPSPQKDAVVDAVLLSGVVLPSYPAVLDEMDALLSQDDFALPQLAVVIARDPSLTAALLRVANSPVFGLRQSVTRLSQAVAILGLGRVQAVVRSEVLRDALRDYGEPKLLHQLWERFGSIGKLAASLATHSPQLRSQSDLAYTVGMFHAAGCFIVIKRFPNETRGLVDAHHRFEETMTTLNQQLKTDHCSIGGMVAKSWRLPAEVVEAIAKQRYWQTLTGVSAQLACVLRLAVMLHDGEHGTEAWQAIWPHAQTLLGLDEVALEEIFSSMIKAQSA